MSKLDKVDRATLLEQYKLYVEMADRISQRRHSANSYFLGISTALISLLIAFLAYVRYTGISATDIVVYVVIGVSMVGAINCYIWYLLIKSYKAMNTAKYRVIQEMEADIGYQPYTNEWEYLGRGEDKAIYRKFTDVESYVPLVFCVFYVAAIVLTLVL